jgi:acetyl esterase/lipase
MGGTPTSQGLKGSPPMSADLPSNRGSTFAFDSQVLAELTPLLAMAKATPQPAIGDVHSRRRSWTQLFDALAAARAPVPGVESQQHTIVADDGAPVTAYWYHRAGTAQSGPAVVYLHGGGMILSLKETGRIYDHVVSQYVSRSGVPMLVVDYRVAPEHWDPRPVADCYAALCWLADNARSLNVDPQRIGIMGDSAGGGLAAGVCLMARDRSGPAIAQQTLVYPMLDDRTTLPDQGLMPFLTWTYDDNITGWSALLGQNTSADSGASPHAAPARASDLSNLPDTYIDVGVLDIFRDEDLVYARRLTAAGVPTELHLYPGCPHAFDLLAAGADVSARAMGSRIRRLRTL